MIPSSYERMSFFRVYWVRVVLWLMLLFSLPAVFILVRTLDEEEQMPVYPDDLTGKTPEELKKLADAQVKLREIRKYQFDLPRNSACSYIDAVYLWVNGTDPLVTEQYKQAFGSNYVENGRMRDIPTMKYSIRALLTYAPFIRQVVIVTNGQRPDWLNISNPRVRIVSHKEIFEHPENLPTFNSNAIEAQILRIPDLAPCYFALNDDFSFGRPVRIQDWIDMRTGRQKLAFDSWKAPRLEDMRRNVWHHSVAFSNLLINKYYHPDEVTEETTEENAPRSYSYEAHNIRLYQQRYMEVIYDHFRKEFLETTKHKTRTRSDTVLSFLYNNAVLEEFGGIASPNLSQGMYYGTFKLDTEHVKKTVSNFVKRKPIAWCLNDAAGKVVTQEDKKKYDEAVAVLEKILSDEFPLPSEVENVEPGQQVIPRTLREYEIMYGMSFPDPLIRMSVLISVVWVALFAYLTLSIAILWAKRGHRKIKSMNIFSEQIKDHNV